MEGFLKERGGLVNVADKQLREASEEPALLISAKLGHLNRQRDMEPCCPGERVAQCLN